MRIVTARRISQVFFFALLIWFCAAATLGERWWQLRGWPVNWLIELDPLAGIGTLLATGTVYAGLLWGLFTIGLTLAFGRVFCGWICPLGTAIDISGRYLRPKRLELRAARERKTRQPENVLGTLFSSRTKYYILFFIFVLALFGVNTAGWLDPLAILLRGTAFALVPAGEYVFENSLGKWVYRGGVFDVILPWYLWLRDAATAPFPHAYAQAMLHLGILLGVLALSRIRRRYWCNVLCPLGAFWEIGRAHV